MGLGFDLWMVGLSLVMAFQGSYVGLHVARRLPDAPVADRRRLIAASAVSLALAIWTMHFVGMLALDLPFATNYLVLPTLLSFLVCVLVVGVAVFLAGSAPLTPSRLILAAVVMGGGIIVMHFLGMSALHGRIDMSHDPLWTGLAVLAGISASGMALRFGFGDRAPRSTTRAAALLALGISAMHYLAIAATDFTPIAAGGSTGLPAFSPGFQAIVVSVVGFLVSGLFLLSLVPEAPAPAEAGRVPETTARPAAPAAPAEDPAPEAAKITDDAPAPVPSPSASAEPSAVGEAPADARRPAIGSLPVERDGMRRSLDVGRLIAVQAQAHYTELFDGEERWFCPMAISEVEERLDPAVFARVHRSHIVNLDRISGMRRSGDSVEVLVAASIPYRVPVARSKNRWLKETLKARPSPG